MDLTWFNRSFTFRARFHAGCWMTCWIISPTIISYVITS